MRLREVMTDDVKVISPNDTAMEAQQLMRRYGINHLVVIEGNQVVGVLSSRDLQNIDENFLKNRDVRDFMTPDVLTAAPDMTVREAANLMRGNTISCLPVMDGHRLTGIVTLSDLLEIIGRGGHPQRRPVRSAPPTERGHGPH